MYQSTFALYFGSIGYICKCCYWYSRVTTLILVRVVTRTCVNTTHECNVALSLYCKEECNVAYTISNFSYTSNEALKQDTYLSKVTKTFNTQP